MWKAGITISDLAEKCGCSRDVIYAYRSRKCREDKMNISVLKRLAKIFGQEEYYFCNEYLIFVDRVNVPAYLLEKRTKRKMSQRQYAAFLEISADCYKLYEVGHTRLQYHAWKKVMKKEENILCTKT